MKEKQLSIAVNKVLDGYIMVHNDIFGFSFRKIIPILGIFKAIDYESCYKKLDFLQGKLNDLLTDIPEHTEYFALLKEYSTALLNTILWLQNICEKFTNKINGKGDYSKGEYNEDMDTYNHSVNNYRSLGLRLNNLYKELESNNSFSEN
jgi:hypothetical protein